MKTVLVFLVALLTFATYVPAEEPEADTLAVEEGAGADEVSAEPSPAYATKPASAGGEPSAVRAAAHPREAAAVTAATDRKRMVISAPSEAPAEIKRMVISVPPETVPKPDKVRTPESEKGSAEGTTTDEKKESAASDER